MTGQRTERNGQRRGHLMVSGLCALVLLPGLVACGREGSSQTGPAARQFPPPRVMIDLPRVPACRPPDCPAPGGQAPGQVQ